MNTIVLAVAISFALFGCVRQPILITKPEEAMEIVTSWNVPVLQDDRQLSDIDAAARQSLEYYKKLPPETPFFFGPEKVTAVEMAATLQHFLVIIENGSLTVEQKLERIKQDFTLYRSVGSDGKGKVLFTGYYEPMLNCRIGADEKHGFPLYRRPDDIIEIDLTQFGNGFPKNKLFGRLDGKKVIPYYSREEIDNRKVLANKDLEILWCTDPVDIYFLQVQGSGKVDLGDGSVLSVLYDGANGRPYKGAGSYLVSAGIIPKEAMSMQMIRQYLRDNPDQIVPILNQNQSYVFFRLDTGPSIGNISVPLTPGRSIATDSKIFPKGALGIIFTQKPVLEQGVIKQWTPFTRFVLNQDTGGAIKGPGRVDLFCGQGAEAEITAGYMQQEGELYFLTRKK